MTAIRKNTTLVSERYCAQLHVREGQWSLVDQDDRHIVGPCRSEALLETICFRLVNTTKKDIPTADEVRSRALVQPWVRL
jgi:hypothetical protein